ncbi:MAG: hypothetical protein NUV54_01935, partial [Candidatus Taylorbacteria bacterium]|nr:hypothetical protein [Candidatus Taylorbacteria bacterium]
EDIVSKLNDSAEDIGESTLSWLKELQSESKSAEDLEVAENTEILERRRRWSDWVLILIVTIVIFDMIIVWLYGSRVWTFDNPNVVIAVITENFLKIVGLGFLITRETFNKIYHQ